MSSLRRLWKILSPHRVQLWLGLGWTLLLSATTGAYAYLVGPLLKLVLARQAEPLGLPWLSSIPAERLRVVFPLLLLGVVLAKVSSQFAQGYLLETLAQRAVSQLRRSLYGHMLTLSPAYFDERHSGDLLSRFAADVQGVEVALVAGLTSYVRDLLTAVALLAVCAVLDPRLLLLSLVAAPVVAVPVAWFARALRTITAEVQQTLGRLTSQVGEIITGIRVVQAYRQEEAELQRFQGEQQRYLSAMDRSLKNRSAYSPTIEILGVAGLSAVVAYAAQAIGSGALKPEAFFSFIAAQLLMYRPIKALANTGQMMVQGLACAQRLFDVLDARSPVGDRPGAVPLPEFREQLRFDKLCFRYGERWALREVDLTVRRGEVVALVGASGSGKSTLGSLLLRFYDPQEGAVRLDGVDIREGTLRSLRAQISLVTQEPVLFSGTVRENIACGRPGASEQDIAAAARAANAWGFIQALPAGLDAEVGERGCRFSGGQRQRIAIARALLKGAPILLLDEATSALDAESEAEVQQGIDALLEGRTSLVIAHRPSAVRGARRVVVLEEGRVVEEGTPEELLSRGGAFARLYRDSLGADGR